MPWQEFSGITDELRNVAIRKQILFNCSIHSLIIPGFIDNGDNVYMKGFDPDKLDLSSHSSDDKLGSTFVSDYIAYIPAGDGEPVFQHVYPPCNGIREVLVKWYNHSEAKELIKVIHGELAKHMNEVSIQLAFEDPNKAKEISKTSHWVPYSRAAQLLQESKDNHLLKNPNKRTRTSGRDTTIKNGRNYSARKSRAAVKTTSVAPTTAPSKAPTTAPTTRPAAWVVPPTVTHDKDPTVSTATESAAIDLEDFKKSVCHEISINNKKIQEQIKHDIAKVKMVNEQSVKALETQMDAYINNLHSIVEDSNANNTLANDILESKLDTQTEIITNRINNLEHNSNIHRSKLENQYDEIKNLIKGLEQKLTTGRTTKRKNENDSIDISHNNDDLGEDMSILDVSHIAKTSAVTGLLDTQND
jgi:hypothetical protein